MLLKELWATSPAPEMKQRLTSTSKSCSVELFSWLLFFHCFFLEQVSGTTRSCAHATGTFPLRNAVGTPVLHSLLSLRNAVIRNRFEWNNKTNPFSFVPPMTLPFQSPSLNADSKPLSNPTRPASRTALFRRCYS